MKTRKLGIFSVFIGALLMHSGLSNAFTVDTNSLNGSMTGLWNNANEPGWGATVTHQYNKIFATFYTYESNGTPVWYVASDCSVTGDGCSGELYQVNGGTPLISAWNGANKVVKSVGSIDFAFSGASTGAIGFTINGVSGTKSIEKSVFASAPVVSEPINKTNTAKLVGGTWSFMIDSDVLSSYRFYSVDTTSTSDGWYIAQGRDPNAGSVTGGYKSNEWYVHDPEPAKYVTYYFKFTFTDDSHVSGCAYVLAELIGTDINNPGTCVPMHGSR